MGESVCTADAVTRVYGDDEVTRFVASKNIEVGPQVHMLLTRELDLVCGILGAASSWWSQKIDHSDSTCTRWISSAHIVTADGEHRVVAVAVRHDDRTARAALLGELFCLTGELVQAQRDAQSMKLDYENVCRPSLFAEAAQ